MQVLAILGSVVDPSLGSWVGTLGPGLSASYFASAAAAGQRLEALYLFARLLIKGGVAEVDVPVQAGVRVILVVGCCMEGIAGWRYSVLVHSDLQVCVGRVPGCSITRGAIPFSPYTLYFSSLLVFNQQLYGTIIVVFRKLDGRLLSCR